MSEFIISPSQRARVLWLAIYLTLAICLAFAELRNGLLLPAQLMLAAVMLYSARMTAGLGRGARLWQRQGEWYFEAAGTPSQPLQRLQVHWVNPRIVSLRLQGDASKLSVLAVFDSMPEQQHWELRRWALHGVATKKAD